MKKGRQVTMKEIAKKLGVSVSTVSRALQDSPELHAETKRKIVEAAKEMNYRPNLLAQSLRISRSKTLGVIVPEITSHFFASCISGIQDTANTRGYNVMICQSNERISQEKANIQTLVSSQVDGLLISLSRETNTYEHLYELYDREINFLLFDRVQEDIPVSKVTFNDVSGAYQVVKHLLENGSRRIVYVSGPEDLYISKKRKEGYLRALTEFGVAEDPSLVLITDLTLEGNLQVAQHILAMDPRPEAVFCMIDPVAVDVLTEWKKSGIRIPEDIALAGFTNKSKNLLLVPASFIAVTSFALGTYLMDGFISAIAGSIAVAISCALVFENSTKSSWTKLFVMGLAVIFAVFTWTLILIPVLILMLPKFWEWLDVSNRSTGMYLRVSVTLIGVVFVTYAFVTFYSEYLFSILNTSGRIQAADARAFIVLLLIILFLAILNVSRKSPTGFQLALISLSGAATIYALNRMSGIPFLSLNYYSAKAMMILFVGFLPTALIFIPIGIKLISRVIEIKPMRMTVLTGYTTLLIYFATEFISPFPKVWSLMNNGWFQPSAQTASEVIGLANDPSNPTVFFKYNPSNSGETRLGNFWLGTYADPVSPIKSWAYVGDQEGNYAAFCELNSYYSRMTVLTRDPNLNIRISNKLQKLVPNYQNSYAKVLRLKTYENWDLFVIWYLFFGFWVK